MFKPYEAIPAKKVASRPSRFKLAYVENSINQDRKGFDMESDTKTALRTPIMQFGIHICI